jgi:hypothetical protein
MKVAYQLLGLLTPALDHAQSTRESELVARAHTVYKLRDCPGSPSGHED